MSENPNVMNEIGLLNVRLNDLMNQLNKTVKVLLEENQQLTQEIVQLKNSSPPNPVEPSPPVKTGRVTKIFEDNFNSGKFNNWSSVNPAAGTSITISPDWSQGTSLYSALFENKGLNNVIMNLQKTIPAANQVNIRAYINFEQLSIVNTGYVNLFSFNSGGVNAMLDVRAVSGVNYFEVQYYSNGAPITLRSKTATLTAGTIRCVEFHLKHGNGNGAINVYVDGAEVKDLAITGINRSAATTLVCLGSTWAQWAGAGNSFKMYFGNVVIADSYIGPDKQTAQKYKVTYDGNRATSGNVPVDSNTYEPGASVTVQTNPGALTRAGFSFRGWDTNSTAATPTYTVNKNTVTPSRFTMGSANVVLYSVWQANPTYTVTYNSNGATDGTAPTDVNQYENGAAVTIAANPGNLSKAGYTFRGWAANSAATTPTYTVNGSTVTPPALTMGTNNVVLYAVWQENSPLPPPSVSNLIDYQVTKTETLPWVAQKFGTDAVALRKLNGLSNDNVAAGQVLKVPVGVLPLMDAEFYKCWRLSIPTGEQLTPAVLQKRVYRAWWYPGVGDFEGYLMMQTPREGGNVSTLGAKYIRTEFRENVYDKNTTGHDWGLYGYHKMTYEAKAYVVNAKPGGPNAKRSFTDMGQFWGSSGGNSCMFELAYGPAPIENKNTSFRWRHAKTQGVISYGVGTVVPVGKPFTATFECAGGVMRVWVESSAAGIAKKLLYEERSPAAPDANSYHFQVGNYDASSDANGAEPNPMDVHTLVGYKYIKVEHNPICGRLTYSNGTPVTLQTVKYVVNGGGISNVSFSAVTDTEGYYYIPYVPSQGGANCAAVNITVPTITGHTANKTGTINVPATAVTKITSVRTGAAYDIVYTPNI